MKKTEYIADEELLLQRQYAQKVRALLPEGRTYHIATLGCQMNVRDSETIAGLLEEMGFSVAESKESADLVLYNTCCIRENAENKALGNVIWLKELKKERPDMLICVGGCMMQEEGVAEKLSASYPFIDVIFGTHNTHRLPQLVHRALTENEPAVEIIHEDGSICEGLPAKRSDTVSAFVNIMYGCDNFCSYCIVPYVRGRERSRREEDILDEVKSLRDEGVQEIMLLGQNVNSYGGGGNAFAELLYKVNALEIPRIRFMTSHPKDLSDALIDAISSLPHVCNQLHLPVQSGNDRILRLMNRRYTRERYFDLVQKLRSASPEIGLTTDTIVGFPGETEEEFEDTLSLIKTVRFDAAYTFIYSKRRGTPAAKMEDGVSDEEKTERIIRLISAQQEITREILKREIGKTIPVLVESASARDAGSICGKTERGQMVNFQGDAADIGKILPIRIVSAGKNTLRGIKLQ